MTEGEEIVIGTALSDDCEQLARLEVAAFEANKDVIWPLMFPPADEQVAEQRLRDRAHGLQQILEAGKGKLMTAKIGSVIVGWTHWIPPGQDEYFIPRFGGFFEQYVEQCVTTRKRLLDGTRYWYLQVLAVDPIIWNRGIGRKLVQWGLDEVDRDSLGPADVFLEAGLRAEAFYNRLGFETLRWDSLDFKDAPDGQVKWPLMLRRGSKGSTS